MRTAIFERALKSWSSKDKNPPQTELLAQFFALYKNHNFAVKMSKV